MDGKELENIQSRCDAKLRYAKLYLDELALIEILGGSDVERAHSESFLYHLLGAKDSFLHELNIYYGANLTEESVSHGNLRNKLKTMGIKSEELSELYRLENDETSWLSIAKLMRDVSTHVQGVKRSFHIGGVLDGHVFLKHPNTKLDVTGHYIKDFEQWDINMSQLLTKLRESALSTNKLKI